MIQKILSFVINKERNDQKNIIKNLIKVTLSLVKTTNIENQVLDSGRISNLENILQEKVRLLDNFKTAILEFKKYTKRDDYAPFPNLLMKLREALTNLDSVSKKNDLLLQANAKASEQIVSFYKEQKIKNSSNMFSYKNTQHHLKQDASKLDIYSVSVNSRA